MRGLLTCESGKSHAREKRAGLFWGRRFEVQTLQSQRQALSALRKQLGPEVVDANRGQVRLAESFPSDVSRFLALIASGNRDDLKQAVELYEDDLLTGFSLEEASFTEWLATEDRKSTRLHSSH